MRMRELCLALPLACACTRWLATACVQAQVRSDVHVHACTCAPQVARMNLAIEVFKEEKDVDEFNVEEVRLRRVVSLAGSAHNASGVEGLFTNVQRGLTAPANFGQHVGKTRRGAHARCACTPSLRAFVVCSVITNVDRPHACAPRTCMHARGACIACMAVVRVKPGVRALIDSVCTATRAPHAHVHTQGVRRACGSRACV